jgi:hypothetical protein
MNTIIDNLKRLRPVCLGMFAALAMSLDAQGMLTPEPIDTNIVSVARAAAYLVTAPLTTTQVQVLHAQNFNQLPPSLRPLYLHAVAFQVGVIVAADAPLPASALVEYLQTADPDEFFNIDTLLPEEDEGLIIEGLREVNLLIANQIAANNTYQRAIRSGAANGFWNGTDWAW